MAQTTRKVLVTKLAEVDRDRPSEVIDLDQLGRAEVYRNTTGVAKTFAYIGIANWPSSLKNNRLYSAKAVVKADRGYRSGTMALEVAAAEFDKDSITWSNKPARYGDYRMVAPEPGSEDTTLTMEGDSLTNADRSLFAMQILQKKTLIFGLLSWNTQYGSNYYVYETVTDGTAAYIEITYDNSETVNSKITENGCPTSGYFDPRNARKFAWTYEINDAYRCAGAFTQRSATLYWRVAGASTWNNIAASGATQNVTVQANTFPTNSTIEWYLAGTDTNGCASTSPVYTISTAASLLSASPVSPVNSVEDGSKDIVFRWSLEDAANTKGIWVGYTTTEGGALSALADLPSGGAVTEWTAAGGTFPAGTVYWGVRVYNKDGVLGSTASAQFLSVAAPADPEGLAATPVPFTTITWQSAEQQAYRILIDGEEVASGFGTTKSYSAEEALQDGTHIIGVQVQGLYGIWSSISEISINVENAASGNVTLSAEFGIDAELEWESTASAGTSFQVYRDGVRIASTSGNTYSDRTVLGAHAYKVLQKLSDGNYVESETATGMMAITVPVIGLLNEAGWLEMRLTEDSERRQKFTWTKTHSLRHIAGAKFPFLEMSPYADASGSYECTFISAADEEAFENMRGKIVIIKSDRNDVVIGLLAEVQKNAWKFFSSYSFTVQQIQWEEFVNADA